DDAVHTVAGQEGQGGGHGLGALIGAGDDGGQPRTLGGILHGGDHGGEIGVEQAGHHDADGVTPRTLQGPGLGVGEIAHFGGQVLDARAGGGGHRGVVRHGTGGGGDGDTGAVGHVLE